MLKKENFQMGNFSIAKKKVEGHTTYHLKDRKQKMDFSLAPDIGNWGYSFKANGKEVFYAPASLEQYIKDRGLGSGNPLMAPFANRIDRDYYYFEGKKYLAEWRPGKLPAHFPDQLSHSRPAFLRQALGSGQDERLRLHGRGDHFANGLLQISRPDGAVSLRPHP